jgi:hypothetical protein
MADDASGFTSISISSQRYGGEREVESLLARPPSAVAQARAFLRYSPSPQHTTSFHLL